MPLTLPRYRATLITGPAGSYQHNLVFDFAAQFAQAKPVLFLAADAREADQVLERLIHCRPARKVQSGQRVQLTAIPVPRDEFDSAKRLSQYLTNNRAHGAARPLLVVRDLSLRLAPISGDDNQWRRVASDLAGVLSAAVVTVAHGTPSPLLGEDVWSVENIHDKVRQSNLNARLTAADGRVVSFAGSQFGRTLIWDEVADAAA
jgi:hypothetical protein